MVGVRNLCAAKREREREREGAGSINRLIWSQ